MYYKSNKKKVINYIMYTFYLVGIISVILLTSNFIVYLSNDRKPIEIKVSKSRLRMINPNIKERINDKFLSTNENGFRKAPWHTSFLPVRTEYNRKVIYMFGGSTTFGSKVADDETIPAYLEREIEAMVVNFGQENYSMHQEVYLLVDNLLKGNIPDYVVFYDGVNEGESFTNIIYQGVPEEFEQIDVGYAHIDKIYKIGLIEGRRFWYIENWPLSRWLVKKIFWPMDWVKNQLYFKGRWSHPVMTDSYVSNYARATAESYVEHMVFIKKLANEFSFTPIFILHPYESFVTDYRCFIEKPSRVYWVRPAWKKMDTYSEYFYYELTLIASEKAMKIHDLSGVFNNGVYKDKAFFTDFCHLTADGNKFMATKIAEIFKPYLSNIPDPLVNELQYSNP
jgi:hypothetical protein